MDERPTKETIIDDGETGTNDQRRPSLLLPPPSSSSPQLPSLLPSPMPSSPSQTMTQLSANPPATSSSPHKAQKVAFTSPNDLQPSRRSAPPPPSATSPFSSPSVPLDTLLFAKRPVPPLRQPTLPLPSQINMSRTSSFSSSVSSSLGFAGDDGVPLPSSPTDNFPSSPTSISPPPQPISLLSQILVTHSQKLSSLGGGGGSAGGGALVSPLSSTPNSTASSPVGGASAQLHGIFRRRGSAGASEVLDKVGEEEMGIEEQLEGYNIAATTLVPRPSIFAGASPNLSPRTRSTASSPSKRFLPPPPPSPTRPSTGTRAPSRLMFSEPDRNSATSTPDLHSSPEATSSSFPSSPVAGVVDLPLPAKRVGLVFIEDPEIVSRRSISTAPPSPTQPSLPPTLPLPQKKPSNLTFAVTSVCARPPAMGKTPGPDREMEDDDEEEEDEEDDDLNGEVDLEDDEEEDEEDEEDDGSLDEDGYLEDDEEDASSEEDEEGVSSSPAERRRYRYKRHALFGEDSTDEDEEDEEDGFGGEDDVDEDGSLRTRKSARDSVLSNFSFDKTVNDSAEAVSKMLAETSLRHRRSASLKRRSASLALLDPPPPVPPLPSTSTLPHPSSSTAAPTLLSARRTHFPTPLVLRQDHSAFPRSPVPKSIVRGGGGYSPRVRKGTRMAAGVQAQDPTRARLGRDDFLPTHLKSEEGKERERERERERDSTTDQGGGVSSGKCSRHRSPPPSSAGRDKMKAHGERRSRSVVAGGEGSRAASSSRTRRTSKDVGRVALPHPPSPILKRNPTSTSAAPPSRVVLTAGELTPVFLTDVEDSAPIARQPPSAFRPTLISPTTITTTSILQSTEILSPPPSRRESSSERRASLSAVCSVFQRSSFSTTSAHNSDDPSSSQLPTISRIRRPSIALDGSSSAPYTQRSAAGATFVDGSALTQSLQKALGGGGGERSIRPFSPPPTAPSSFVPPRFPTANLPAASSSVPTRQIAKRRFSQPPIPTTGTTTTTPVKSRPIACPARGGGGGWTDGG